MENTYILAKTNTSTCAGWISSLLSWLLLLFLHLFTYSNYPSQMDHSSFSWLCPAGKHRVLTNRPPGNSHKIDHSYTVYWRRWWHPTPVLFPGKSHGWRSLVGCSPWGRWGSDTMERLHFHFSLSCIGEVATHSSVLAWRIPGAVEPGGLPSMGSHRVGHDWSDLAAAAAYNLCSIICFKNKNLLLTPTFSSVTLLHNQISPVSLLLLWIPYYFLIHCFSFNCSIIYT